MKDRDENGQLKGVPKDTFLFFFNSLLQIPDVDSLDNG